MEAFYAEEIGVGHALLLAKLQPDQQEKALEECFREEWAGAGKKPKRMLLPVRHLQQWIEQRLMLILDQAPFNKQDAQLMSSAGSCVDCPKRTGHNKLLFAALTEVLIHPLRQGNQILARQYSSILLNAAHVRTLAVSPLIAAESARLRASHGYRTPDAIQLATAQTAHAAFFL
jgi:hypothetical protein